MVPVNRAMVLVSTIAFLQACVLFFLILLRAPWSSIFLTLIFHSSQTSVASTIGVPTIPASTPPPDARYTTLDPGAENCKKSG